MRRHQSARASAPLGAVALVLLAVCGSGSYGQQLLPAWQRNQNSPKPPTSVAGKRVAPQGARTQAVAKPQAAMRQGTARQSRSPRSLAEMAFMSSESAARHAVRPASGQGAVEYVHTPPPEPMMVQGSAPCGCNDGSCDLGCPYEIGCGCEPSCGPCSCCDDCGMGCGCADCCQPGCTQPGGCLGGCAERGCVPLMLYAPPIKELTIFGGVQGFKGPLDFDRDRGNFGFHEGFNIGGYMGWLPIDGLGYQAGFRATQNQLHGDFESGTSEGHNQNFVTAGLFRRACVGLQGGLVYDWMRDERIESTDFSQIRGELGLVNPRGHEFGFTFGVHLDDTFIDTSERFYQTTDWYLLYYRVKKDCRGEVRAFAGFDDGDRGVLGTDYLVALNNRWSLNGGFTYYIPDDNNQGEAASEEGWNIGMSLVWNYGCRAKSSVKGPFRPLFNVADNGSMFVDDRP